MPPGLRLAPLICGLLLGACGSSAPGAAIQDQAIPGLHAASSGKVARAVPGDWTRFGFDAQRSGVGPANTGITTSNLGRLRRRRVRLDGTVDSSVIELHAVRVGGRKRDALFMTTTYGRTLAIDAGTGRKLWEYVPPDIHAYQGSAQITTATPVADPDRRFLYAAAPDGLVRKLSVSTGRAVRSALWPARVTFDAGKEKIASALNISGSELIVVTGGYIGDAPAYQGHVVTVDLSSGRILQVWNSLCSNRHHLIHPPASCPASGSAIWARAGAVVEPGSGRLLLATGNGPWNGSTNWGDSVLELTPDASRLLHNWTPTDQAQLNSSDTDVGSTAPAPLPRFRGRRLAVQGGKDGLLHLLNLSRLNGTTGGAGSRLGGESSHTPAPGGGEVFTAPVVWSSGGRTYVFVATMSGTTGYVLGPRRARLNVAWRRSSAGTSPILAGGLLYVFDPLAGKLEVLAPSTGHELASLPADSGHWNSPIAIGGRIVLPVGDSNSHSSSGTLFIYHLPGR